MYAVDRFRSPASTEFPPRPLAWRLWYWGWKPGPIAPSPDQPVFVSLTDFYIHHLQHAPGAWRTGLRLRRSWPRLAGAIGLWLWSEPFRLRSGSVSIWESEEALTRFVRSEIHCAIVHEYQRHMSGTSCSWIAPEFDRAAIWSRAVSELSTAGAEIVRAPRA
jgi:hypothetical protein